MGNRKVLAALVGVVVVALVVLVVIKVLASPASQSGASGTVAPHFVEQASAAGIAHAYEGDFEFYVGGGVAVFDCDGDGMPDMYLAGGTNPAGLYRNASDPGGEL